MSRKQDIPPFIKSDTIPADRPVVTAAVVPFTDGGEVVMFRHRNGLIEYLGGHIEAGELTEDAVRRESIEEGGAVLGEPFHLVGYLVFDGERPSYNPLYVAPVEKFVPVPEGTESAGRLVFKQDEVLEAIRSTPDHRWKKRHGEMMEFALDVIRNINSV